MMHTPKQKRVFERYWHMNPDILHVDFSHDLLGVVVIPVLNDYDIFRTIDSLSSCIFSKGTIGVVIVVNHSEKAASELKRANILLAQQIRDYILPRQNERMEFHIIEAFDLPAKTAGVGLARKLGMDAAAHWLCTHDSGGMPIFSLDADTCVAVNYIDVVCQYFANYPVAGVSITYEHRLAECEKDHFLSMVKYELYLRYYQIALSYCGHPHAYPCLGSAFVVRAEDYVAEGGMNKKQAGEDFYFIQKLISTGRYAWLKNTRVYPSPRISVRTPFGTGRSVLEITEMGAYPVYSWRSFEELKFFLGDIITLYKCDMHRCKKYIDRQFPSVRQYMSEMNMADIIMEVNANCASGSQFVNRFFDRFNAFRVLRYMNEMHDRFYIRQEISEAADDMFLALGYPVQDTDIDRLEFLRNL